MEVMFKVSVPDGYDVFWEGFLGYLQEVAPDYDNDAKFSISGPILSDEEQNAIFDRVYELLDYMPSHYIRFGSVDNKVYCSLIPVKPAKLNEATTGVASCHEDDDSYYEYGCILAFARALKDESLESQILMCDPKAAEEYFKDVSFDMIC